jgi:hypothetical protein
LTNNIKFGDWDERGKAFFSKNARFDYQPPAVGSLLCSMSKPAGAMLIWLIVSGLVAVFFFNKLKPI